ncbi:zinc-binding dehydrogenase [Lysobacter sp. A3-1-A15]|uniref:zinc-binding dehydrogenase n=1 Tax=Novilysobacter viscosus TaxID=3098602 RepID=UPI002ED9EA7E
MSPLALIFRGITLRGFWLARWFELSTPEQRQSLFGSLASQIIAGTLHAPVARRFGLDDISQALTAAAQGGRSGKIVLVPNGDPSP